MTQRIICTTNYAVHVEYIITKRDILYFKVNNLLKYVLSTPPRELLLLHFHVVPQLFHHFHSLLRIQIGYPD